MQFDITQSKITYAKPNALRMERVTTGAGTIAGVGIGITVHHTKMLTYITSLVEAVMNVENMDLVATGAIWTITTIGNIAEH